MRFKRLSLFGLILAGLVMYVSCRKMDRLENQRPEQDVTTRFFTDHPPIDPNVQVLADLIRSKNEQSHFVNKIVQTVGYPRWNSVMSYSSADGHSGNTSRTGTNDSLDLYFIPFVRDTQQIVNACLIIKARGRDTSYKWLCDWQYKDSAYTGLSRRNTAALLMLIDAEVFGQQRKYLVSDTTLFDSRTSPARINGTSILNTSAQGRSAVVEICVTYQAPVNGWLSGCEPGSPCNPYQDVTICTSTTLDDNLGGGNNINNGSGWTAPQGGGGGSTAGWTQPPANPCALFSTGGREPELPPGCTEAYGSGWVSVEESGPPPSEPTDSLLARYSRAIKDTAIYIYDNLSQPPNKEYAFTGILSNGQIRVVERTTNGDSLQVFPKLMIGNVVILFTWHSHVSRSSNLADRSTFSHADIDMLRHIRCLKQNFVSFADCRNKRYALVIEDITKAKAFFNTNDLDSIVAKYTTTNASGTTQDIDERKVINVIGSVTVSGIGFYVSNDPPVFQTWTLLNP